MHEPSVRARHVSSSYLKCFQQPPHLVVFMKGATNAAPLLGSYGPVTSGFVGPNSPTHGTPRAPDICSRPVSTPTTKSHLSSSAATLSSDVCTGSALDPACAKTLCVELSGRSQNRSVR